MATDRRGFIRKAVRIGATAFTLAGGLVAATWMPAAKRRIQPGSVLRYSEITGLAAIRIRQCIERILYRSRAVALS